MTIARDLCNSLLQIESVFSAILYTCENNTCLYNIHINRAYHLF